ncbi:hypothetical protein LTR08_000785 [Meristemomyces frigidus]|nr:hypothetical protein LTR08_000785 [Meristemomyces frigidus]
MPPRTARLRSHLASWVMLSPATTPPYTPLPNETTLFTSPPRIAFALSTPAHYPGKQHQPPFALSHATGVLYLTNRRLIYLPDKPTATFQSFAAPILNLHDSHVSAPFFGANQWLALLQPVQGGGVPVPGGGVVEIKLTFKEGGAFDFHTCFERVKERLGQAVEVGRMQGEGGGGAARGGAGVGLEDLPAYREESEGPLMSPVGPPVGAVASQRDSGVAVEGCGEGAKPAEEGAFSPPLEPPPGYEEVVRQG